MSCVGRLCKDSTTPPLIMAVNIGEAVGCPLPLPWLGCCVINVLCPLSWPGSYQLCRQVYNHQGHQPPDLRPSHLTPAALCPFIIQSPVTTVPTLVANWQLTLVTGYHSPRCVSYCASWWAGQDTPSCSLVKGGTVATCDPSSLNTGAGKFFMIWMGYKSLNRMFECFGHYYPWVLWQ